MGQRERLLADPGSAENCERRTHLKLIPLGVVQRHDVNVVVDTQEGLESRIQRDSMEVIVRYYMVLSRQLLCLYIGA